jgi:hypothetical protein
MIVSDDSGKRADPPRKKRPKPVPGEQIRLSKRMTLWCLLGFAVWGVGSGILLGVVLQEAYEYAFHNGPAPDPFVRLIIGGGGVVGAPLLSYRLLWKVRRGRRIVIGTDRLQIVEGLGEDTTVLVSVPYANIEVLKCVEIGYWHQLELEVCDTHDPETYFAGINIEENFRTLGHHYEIAGGYELPMEEIEALIRHAWKRSRKKRGETEPEEANEDETV